LSLVQLQNEANIQETGEEQISLKQKGDSALNGCN
jgi:hypothetical protein